MTRREAPIDTARRLYKRAQHHKRAQQRERFGFMEAAVFRARVRVHVRHRVRRQLAALKLRHLITEVSAMPMPALLDLHALLRKARP